MKDIASESRVKIKTKTPLVEIHENSLRPLLVHVNETVLVVDALLVNDCIRLALDDRVPEHDLVLGLF